MKQWLWNLPLAATHSHKPPNADFRHQCRITRKVKVQCTLVQALRLCTDRTAHRGIRVIALLFHDHGTRRGWGVSVTPRPLITLGIDPVPIVKKAGWASGPVWTGAENLAPTGIRSPDQNYTYYVLFNFKQPLLNDPVYTNSRTALQKKRSPIKRTVALICSLCC